jgi:MoaA/NifB/PqqE/SkfB family radical SAM enzyme
MEMGEHIHWFITSRCNSDCAYCFKPDNPCQESAETLETIAQILVDNKVKQVTLGGGEPTLVKGLDKVLQVLKDGGAYVSLHTNGLLLNKEKIAGFSGLVDDIALPLDSLDAAVQESLRGKQFIPNPKIFKLANAIQEKGMQVCYHTVFTALNCKGIPRMYAPIRQNGFLYWRIYEFNEDLALNRVLNNAKEAGLNKALEHRYYEIVDHLRGAGTPEKGFTDCLFAYFLLAEKEMRKHRDKRVQFVGVRDHDRQTYAFLENNGDVCYYRWFSGRERRKIGNVIKDGFSTVIKTLRRVENDAALFDEKANEDFVNAINDRPLWARLWEGNYFEEEFDEINPRYIPLFNRLQALYEKREKKLDQSA